MGLGLAICREEGKSGENRWFRLLTNPMGTFMLGDVEDTGCGVPGGTVVSAPQGIDRRPFDGIIGCWEGWPEPVAPASPCLKGVMPIGVR